MPRVAEPRLRTAAPEYLYLAAGVAFEDPPIDVTVTVTVRAEIDLGTVTTTESVEYESMVARTVPNITVVTMKPKKFDPEILTLFPPWSGPVAGATDRTIGVGDP